MKIESLLAKSCTECDSKFLTNHTKMVINYGLFLGSMLFNEHKKNFMKDEKDEFLKELAIALAIHDLGKCTNNFQKSLKKIKFSEDGSEEYNKNLAYNHNVYSWAYATSRLNLNAKKYQPITSGVLYHHVVFSTAENDTQLKIMSTLEKDEIETFDNFYTYILSYIKDTFNFEYGSEFSIKEDIDDISEKTLSSESLFDSLTDFSPKSIANSSKRALMRACIILADREVSSGEYDGERMLNNDLDYFKSLYTNITESSDFNIDIFNCGYDNERLKKQVNIIDEICKSNCKHSVISASAGFGKTLMGIIWFLKEHKKLTWVLPRNVIADGTYRSVIRELEKIGIADSVKVALFRSGDVMQSNCDIDVDNLNECDILITNIDSILNRNIKNNTSNQLVNLYSSNVIFDEYHEFLCQEPLFPAFIRLMQTRAYYTNSKTILLSATPMRLDFCGLSECENLIRYYNDTEILHGDMNVKIKVLHLDDAEDLKISSKDSFVITNTVPQSQGIFKSNDNSTLFHARFTDSDRSDIENFVYSNHGKDSNVNERGTIVGTNVIGTGLDVSAKAIYDFVLNPDSTIQRCCGRGGRYGEDGYNNEIEYFVCLINKPNKGVTEIINNTYSKSLHDKWIDILVSLDGKTVTKKNLYDLYYKFYEDNRSEVNELYKSFFNNGSDTMQFLKPKKSSSKKSKESDTKYISNALSFRGECGNVFVTVINDDTNDWSDPISIDSTLFTYGTENNNTMKRKEMINSSTKFEYPSKKSLERMYNIKGNDYTIEKCSKFAYSSASPLPLFTFRYSSKLGLYKVEE